MTDSEGSVINCAYNTQNTDRDPTAHAEINLIRKLAKSRSLEEFSQYYLVSNAESCSMCMSAAIKAGIWHFVFGAPSEPHMEPYLTVSDIIKFCRRDLNVTFGVKEEECRKQINKIREEQGNLAQ